ncbi:MAG: cupin domain-containing protein [Aurantibacter sp.]
MQQIEPLVFYFEDDGITPNNKLPVLIYRDILKNVKEKHADFLEKTFQENYWTNNWRDIILGEDHYHSTTHEVLGISKGSVNLQLGGKNGKQLLVSAGDVIVIPAGVAHRSMDVHSGYEVVGGYPDGRAWDMIYCEAEKYNAAKTVIEALPIPKTDPMFGTNGPLNGFWK